MKHITFFLCTYSSGGAEHQVCELSHMLLGYGYAISIVTFGDAPDHYRMHNSIERVRLGVGKSNLGKFIAILRFFFSVKTDCVLSFGQRESFLALIPLLFRPKIKVLAGERNFTVGKPTKYENILVKWLYKRANYIVPNSFSQTEYLKQLAPKYKDKIITITNYTDLAHYSYFKPPQNSPKLVIGAFCRYAEQKNYARLAQAIKLLKDKNISNFVFHWYGNKYVRDGVYCDGYVEFSKLIEEFGIDDMIVLYDHIRDVLPIVRNCDAVCVPSLHEGWSNTISEAICCGKPLLVSDVSDNGRMVLQGQNGFLFNPYDIGEIATAIEQFVSLSMEERTAMGVKSRRIAESLFDKETFCNKYLELIG